MSDCNVCLGGTDFDFSFDFHEQTERNAKKAHVCCECQETIAVGERYEYTAAHGDDEFFTYKTCINCVEIRRAFSCDGNFICHEALWTEIEEILFPNMTTGCLEKIQTASAKAFLVRRWNEWKGLRKR